MTFKRILPAPLRPAARAVYYRAFRAGVRCWCWYEGLGDARASRRLGFPIPAAALRYRVGGSPSLKSFLDVGRRAAENLAACADLAPAERILDFGCGCGRTLTWLAAMFPGKSYAGTDVDGAAISWCRSNLPFARFSLNGPLPPLEYPDGAFDRVYAISVFTHLNETFQFAWLRELARITSPAGLLILSLHGRTVWESAAPEVERKGFVFRESRKLEGICPAWYHTAFHSEAYVRSRFADYIEVLDYIPRGMGYQDVVIGRPR